MDNKGNRCNDRKEMDGRKMKVFDVERQKDSSEESD